MPDSDQFSIEMGGWGAGGLSERGRKARSWDVWYVRAKTYCGYILIHLNISGTLGHAGTTYPRLSFPHLPEISKDGVSILDRLLGVSPLVELPDPRSDETHPEQWIDFAAPSMIKVLDSLVRPEDLSDEYL